MSTAALLRAFSRLITLVSVTAFAQASHTTPIPTQIPGQNAIMVGVAWYPEQWPESRWEEDLQLMEAAHLKVVRIAEFAWSRMEPSEGHYDFDWLERAIALAAKHHIVSVVGTPTATPPAWLTQKYPDTLRVETDGQRPSVSGTIPTSSAGRSTTNTAMPSCRTTTSPESNFRTG